MPRSEFSEKFFEVMVDHCLLSAGFSIYVPSQRDEGRLGFDSFIGALYKSANSKTRVVGFALQFKIVDKYTRPRVPSEEYKFGLHSARKYSQHNTLCLYNSGAGRRAAYCVPAYIGYSDLYSHFFGSDPLSDCFVIFPRATINDNKYHYITFGRSSAHQHSSEKTSCEIDRLESLLGDQSNVMTVNEFEGFAGSLVFGREDAERDRPAKCRFEDSLLLAYKILY